MNTGDAYKQAGQTLTLENNADWTQEALEALVFIAKRKDPLTVDDLRSVIINEPKSHNCYGALMSKAASMGLIRETGQYTKSTRPEGHSRMIKVWRSQLLPH